MPDVDYMALRREEDRAAAGHLGVETRWLDLLEAPHRGYDSAAALFGPVRAEDAVVPELGDAIGKLFNELRPDLVLAPQGLGGHVDHRQLIRAVFDRVPLAPLTFLARLALRDPQTRCGGGPAGADGARNRGPDRGGAGPQGRSFLRLYDSAWVPIRRCGGGGDGAAQLRRARGVGGAG